MKYILIIIFFLLSSCNEKKSLPDFVKIKVEPKVKVAAIQCYTRMGKVDYNRKLLTRLIRQAAEKGAKIIVLPEAAISGYMNPHGMQGDEITWTKGNSDEYSLSLKNVAETVSGQSIAYFSKLTAELKVYLTVPFIEKNEGLYYNSVVLLDPNGVQVAHHRKKELWNHGDGRWCSKGTLEPQVVDTEYGRLGLMICYDHHIMPPLLAAKNVDIVLYSVGWNGPDNWFEIHFPRLAAKHNFSAVVANWSHEKKEPYWVGTGHSNILYRNGIIINKTRKVSGEHIVLGELKTNPELAEVPRSSGTK